MFADVGDRGRRDMECPGLRENENIALYMMMGAALHPVSKVPAGNILALAGLEGRVNKCATLSDTPECPAMVAVTLQVMVYSYISVFWDVHISSSWCRPFKCALGSESVLHMLSLLFSFVVEYLPSQTGSGKD